MSVFLKYFGAVCITACALITSRSYTRYIKRRVGECECFCRLAERIESMIKCYLSPVGDIFSGFECGERAVMDFVTEVRRGVPLKEAYIAAEKKLSVAAEAKRILSELFSTLGHGYKDGVLKLVSEAREELEKHLASEREEGEKNSKLALALLFGGAVGILLLFI